MTVADKTSDVNWTLTFLCWLVAAVSTLASLFFSEIMELPACVLCWYQRVFMFPLVVVLLVGLFPFDTNSIRYALPLAMIGWGFAFYHFLVYSGIIPEDLQPCSEGVSCTETYLDWFGFISIPLLSLLSFSIIIALLMLLKRRLRQ
jgi:disulfide bond formation protein DsbB